MAWCNAYFLGVLAPCTQVWQDTHTIQEILKPQEGAKLANMPYRIGNVRDAIRVLCNYDQMHVTNKLAKLARVGHSAHTPSPTRPLRDGQRLPNVNLDQMSEVGGGQSPIDT